MLMGQHGPDASAHARPAAVPALHRQGMEVLQQADERQLPGNTDRLSGIRHRPGAVPVLRPLNQAHRFGIIRDQAQLFSNLLQFGGPLPLQNS